MAVGNRDQPEEKEKNNESGVVVSWPEYAEVNLTGDIENASIV